MFRKSILFIFLILLFLLNTILLLWLSGRSSLPNEIFSLSFTLSANNFSKEIYNDYYFETEGNHSGIRIAHLFLVHDHRTSVGAARILKRIWEPKHTYVIHIDRDSITLMNTFIE
jgi:hypothetical protein